MGEKDSFPGWLEIPLGYGNFGIGAGTVAGRAAIALIPRQPGMPAGKRGDPFGQHADIEGHPLPGTVLVSFKDAKSARDLAALCEASAQHIEQSAPRPTPIDPVEERDGDRTI